MRSEMTMGPGRAIVLSSCYSHYYTMSSLFFPAFLLQYLAFQPRTETVLVRAVACMPSIMAPENPGKHTMAHCFFLE